MGSITSGLLSGGSKKGFIGGALAGGLLGGGIGNLSVSTSDQQKQYRHFDELKGAERLKFFGIYRIGNSK